MIFLDLMEFFLSQPEDWEAEAMVQQLLELLPNEAQAAVRAAGQ